MSTQHVHPTTEELHAFNLGELPRVEAAAIETHIGQCEKCCETLLEFSDVDSFIALLRDAEPVPPFPTLDLAAAGDLAAESPNDHSPKLDIPAALVDHPRYQIVSLLGRGGMGHVYKAEHRLMQRTVALKVINPDLVSKPEAVERFHREVRAAARLNHPHIVAAYDAEQAGDTHFLVMEFVEGTELSTIVELRGPLPVSDAVSYIRQAAAGLQHAHEMEMVHRDIKPHNLMLDLTGNVKILDFGLAHLASESTLELADDATADRKGSTRLSQQLTKLGTMMGTPAYIAPEQANDARTADIRSDIYGLGCTFYCLLAGRPPFEADTVADIVRAHRQREVEPLSTRRDDIPAALDAVVDRMMAKDPGQRFQQPAELVEALTELATTHNLNQSRRDATPVTAADGSGRRWQRWLVAAAMLPLLIAAGVILYLATDTGHLEFSSDSSVEGAQVVLRRNGQDYATFDLEAGEKSQTIRAGQYQVVLRGAQDDIDMDVHTRRGDNHNWGQPKDHTRDTVVMYRGGGMMIEVTRRREITPRDTDPHDDIEVLQSFASDQQPLTRDGVSRDGRAWKLTAEGDRTFQLYEFQLPPGVSDCRLFYRADLEATDVNGRAYLEMWVGAADGLQYFSKGYDHAVSGTTRWVTYQTPFILQRNETARSVKLNLVIEGGGTVRIRNIRLEKRSPSSGDAKGFVDRLGDLIKSKAGSPSIEISPMALVRSLDGHTGPVKSVAFSADGTLAVSGSGWPNGDGTVRLWDVEHGRMLRQFGKPGVPVLAVDISRLGQFVASGGLDSKVRVWDVETGEMRHALAGPSGGVESIRFSSDGRRLLSVGKSRGGRGGNARLWDVTSGDLLWSFKAEDWLMSGGFFPSETRLIVAGFKKAATPHLLDTETGEELRRLQPLKSGVHDIEDVAVSPDGQTVAAATSTGHVWLWNSDTGQPLADVPIDERRLLSVAFTPNGEWLLAGGHQGVIHIIDASTYRQVHSVAHPNGSVFDMAVATDGHQVLTAGGTNIEEDRGVVPNDDYSVRLWRWGDELWDNSKPARQPTAPAQLELVRIFDGHQRRHHVSSLAIPRSGGVILSAASDSTARLWDLNTRRVLQSFGGLKRGYRSTAAISGDAQWIAAGDWDGRIRLWQRAQGDEPKWSALAHKGGVTHVEFLPDNQTLVSCGCDSMVRLWDMATGEQTSTLEGHRHWVWDFDISDDGQILATAGFDKALLLWNIPTKERLLSIATDHTIPSAVELSPTGAELAVAFLDSSVRLFNTATGREVLRLTGHSDRVQDVAYTPDGRHLVTAGYDGTLRVWDVKAGRELARATSDKRIFNTVAVTPDGQHVASGGGIWKPVQEINAWDVEGDSAIRLWRLPTSGPVADQAND